MNAPAHTPVFKSQQQIVASSIHTFPLLHFLPSSSLLSSPLHLTAGGRGGAGGRKYVFPEGVDGRKRGGRFDCRTRAAEAQTWETGINNTAPQERLEAGEINPLLAWTSATLPYHSQITFHQWRHLHHVMQDIFICHQKSIFLRSVFTPLSWYFSARFILITHSCWLTFIHEGMAFKGTHLTRLKWNWTHHFCIHDCFFTVPPEWSDHKWTASSRSVHTWH